MYLSAPALQSEVLIASLIIAFFNLYICQGGSLGWGLQSLGILSQLDGVGVGVTTEIVFCIEINWNNI